MYNEITKKLVTILNGLKANEKENNKKEQIKTKKPDYIYYKLGIKYYKNIHPIMLYKNRSNKADGIYETKEFDELVSALNVIFLSFNLSEYYFKKVIEDYPQSKWARDAKEKITVLKKLYKRYENIVVEENQITHYESFINEMGLKMM